MRVDLRAGVDAGRRAVGVRESAAALCGNSEIEFRRFPVGRGDALGDQGGEIVVAGAVDVGAQVLVEVVQEPSGRGGGP
ncbi:hypothetical protein [Actinacidiphila oryziradicis]|uniref:Uncharacterized protein n=1 Tax=Actinacidiphila oryziradicis TaxID=2571141 RepID=A0A4U0SCY1_9ACTN|nr:hypothetical protein [Actinacidiphila oryziradicis]TKA06478.1 hypothetical protein FCI23_31660 [Actinacidiphila oryziradicis]